MREKIDMNRRLGYSHAAPEVLTAMLGLTKHVHNSGLDETLLNLVSLRASQLNHCAYCIDMHWKELRAAAESEQKL